MGRSGPEVALATMCLGRMPSMTGSLREPGKWRKVGAEEPASSGLHDDSPCCQFGIAGPQLLGAERQVGHPFNR